MLFQVAGEMEDPILAFNKACEDATADGWIGWNYQVPEKYLKANGVSLTRLHVQYIPQKYTGKFQFCTAGECTDNIFGECCMHEWGGPCPERYTGEDLYCIHGTRGKLLAYGNWGPIPQIPFRTELTPYEFAKEIYYSYGESEIKKQIDLIIEEEEKPFEELDPDLWSFVVDDK